MKKAGTKLDFERDKVIMFGITQDLLFSSNGHYCINLTYRKDSPTCSKENLRLALTIFASKHWSIDSLDIQRAFLQRKGIIPQTS